MFRELGIQELSDAGVAIAVLVTVIVGFWAIRGIALAWLNVIGERNRREHDRELERIQADKDRELAEAKATQANADALNALRKRLEADATRADLIEATTRSLITSAKHLADLIESAGSRMSVFADHVETKLDTIEKQIDGVPVEVWKIGDPKFDTVLTVLAAMEARLLEKLQPEAEIARSVIREEFGDLINRVRLIVEYLELEQARQAIDSAIASDYLNKSEALPTRPPEQVSQIRHQAAQNDAQSGQDDPPVDQVPSSDAGQDDPPVDQLQSGAQSKEQE